MLKPKKKITKKEIERDPVLEKTVEVEKFIRHNGKNISMILGALALIIIVSIFVVKGKKQKALTASGKLGIAQMSIQSGDVDDGILRLEELIEDFGGTKSAGAAHILLGQTYLEQGDFDNAGKYYADYIKKYGDQMAKSAAYKALGAIAESRGQWNEAVDNYKKALSAADYDFQKDLARLSLANAYLESGDFANADKLVKELQKSDLEYNTKNKIDMLAAKLAVKQK